MSLRSKNFNPDIYFKNCISTLEALDDNKNDQVNQKHPLKLNDLTSISYERNSNCLKNKQMLINKTLHKSLPRYSQVPYEHAIVVQSNKIQDKEVKYNNEFKYSVRFAVNGLSKFIRNTSMPPTNRDIQIDDFGDDAGMIAENTDSIVIGLADGAGGNRSKGIDPRRFSRSLLGYCVHYVKKNEVKSNEMAKLACKSIQILEAKNIEG